MAEILNAHGSKNDIFVAAMTPRDFASDDDLRAFVRRLCDRGGPFGGDGVYFYNAVPDLPEAWFFNPDGSSAEFCGNGMRCLGRVVLDQRGADAAVIRSGGAQYTVRRAATTGEGVRQISLEHPAVDFAPRTPVVAGRNPLTEARLPGLDPALEFTAVTTGNPHLVAVIDKYVESDLIAMGERVAARPDVFPAGANLSVLLPLEPAEVFVRTFERGAGLTASCGSGMAASRAVYSRTGRIDPERRVVVRNAGGHGHRLAAGPPGPVASGPGGQRHVRLPRRDRPIRSGPGLAGRDRGARALRRRDPCLRRPRRAERRAAPRGRRRDRGQASQVRPNDCNNIYPIVTYTTKIFIPNDPVAAALRASRSPGLAHRQRAGAHRDGERSPGRDDLAVDLPR